MKAQTPAEGILKTNDFGNSKWYKVVCGCGQPDHEIDFEVEAEEYGINVNTYVTVKTDYWSEIVKPSYDHDNEMFQNVDWAWKGFVNGVWRKIKLTWTLWTKGYVETQSTIMMSKQQALNYAETLKSAIKDVEKFNSERKATEENKKAVAEASQGDCV